MSDTWLIGIALLCFIVLVAIVAGIADARRTRAVREYERRHAQAWEDLRAAHRKAFDKVVRGKR